MKVTSRDLKTHKQYKRNIQTYKHAYQQTNILTYEQTNIQTYKHTFHTCLIQYFLLWTELNQTQPYIEFAISFSICLMISMNKVMDKFYHCRNLFEWSQKPLLQNKASVTKNVFPLHKFEASVWC